MQITHYPADIIIIIALSGAFEYIHVADLV